MTKVTRSIVTTDRITARHEEVDFPADVAAMRPLSTWGTPFRPTAIKEVLLTTISRTDGGAPAMTRKYTATISGPRQTSKGNDHATYRDDVTYYWDGKMPEVLREFVFGPVVLQVRGDAFDD